MSEDDDGLIYCSICQEYSDHGKASKPMVVTFDDNTEPVPMYPYLEYTPEDQLAS